MQLSVKANFLLPLIGFVIGMIQLVFGVLLTGAGQGSYFFLGMVSAPLSFMGIVVAMIGAVPLWTLLWGLLPHISQKAPRQIFLVTIFLHYISIPVAGLLLDNFEFKYFLHVWSRYSSFVLLTSGFYLATQISIWVCYRYFATRKAI